jgi:signal transduction histidine kinase
VDQGPGIPPGERERVLRRFERGSSGQGSRGAGLGLYVASRILDAHGGTLLLTAPEEGTGTRVVLELRRAE